MEQILSFKSRREQILSFKSSAQEKVDKYFRIK